MKFLTILFMLLTVLYSYSQKSKLKLGQNYQGGKIIYILKPNHIDYDPKVPHGLIIAPNETGFTNPVIWGCSGIPINGANRESIGDGEQNTIDILYSCNNNMSAAKLCAESELNGFNNWYLPSIDELSLIDEYINTIGNNIEFLDANYWSSTKCCDNNSAYAFSFRMRSSFQTNREDECLVRPIRKF